LFIDDPLDIEMSVDAETSLDVSAGAARNFVIAKRPRVGVDYAGHWAKRLLRFYIKGNPWVSRP
jgi:DNA-3-methyladenine glycosylase